MARKVTVINQYLPISKTKVAVYCRVSTGDEEQIHSLNSQITYYKDLVGQHFDWELIDIYIDVKSGKSTTGRTEFKKMLADCFSNKIDLIITKSISRFGRNTVDVMDAINKLADHSVDVFFKAENIHTKDVGYSFLIPLLEAAAQAESEARSENIK
jgi:DNA invertase Pin-like site-specific DNA recombinase